jgi:Tfp pilus assembly protein PilF
MAIRTRRQQLEEMLVEEPNDPELRYMLAMEFVSTGDDAAAVRGFEELLELAPDYPHAYHQAGRALVRLGKVGEAQEMLRRGIPVARQRGDEHAAGEMQGLLESLE